MFYDGFFEWFFGKVFPGWHDHNYVVTGTLKRFHYYTYFDKYPNRYVEISYSELPYACVICGKEFVEKFNYKYEWHNKDVDRKEPNQ